MPMHSQLLLNDVDGIFLQHPGPHLGIAGLSKAIAVHAHIQVALLSDQQARVTQMVLPGKKLTEPLPSGLVFLIEPVLWGLGTVLVDYLDPRKNRSNVRAAV